MYLMQSLHAVDAQSACAQAADALGLAISGEKWDERLEIKKKGGGFHFDEQVT